MACRQYRRRLRKPDGWRIAIARCGQTVWSLWQVKCGGADTSPPGNAWSAAQSSRIGQRTPVAAPPSRCIAQNGAAAFEHASRQLEPVFQIARLTILGVAMQPRGDIYNCDPSIFEPTANFHAARFDTARNRLIECTFRIRNGVRRVPGRSIDADRHSARPSSVRETRAKGGRRR